MALADKGANFPSRLAWLLVCAPALTAGAQTVVDLGTLAPGQPYERELRGTESHRYTVPAHDGLLIEVENLGRGTVLSAYGTDEQRLLRAANWRGVEGRYRTVLPGGPAATLLIEPDAPRAPDGSYRISARPFFDQDAGYAAETAMTAGSDALLMHYFGELDSRESALRNFQTAIDEFRIAGDDGRLADALFEAAGVYYNQGQHDDADPYYAEAESLWLARQDSRGVAAARTQRGLIAWRTNRLDDAARFFADVAQRRQQLGDTHAHLQAVNNLGLVHRDYGDPRAALDRFREALEGWQGGIDLLTTSASLDALDSASPPPRLADALVAMNNLGWATEQVGNPLDAEDIYGKALEWSALVNRDRAAAEIRSNLARVRFRLGDLQSAIELLELSLDYFESGAADELWAAHVHHGLGEVYRAAGDDVRAQVELQEALRLRTIERDPVSRALTLLLLAEIAADAGDFRDALLRASDAASITVTGEPAARIRARGSDLAARALAASGRAVEALGLHDRAVDGFIGIGDRRDEALARLNRAASRQLTGRKTQAGEDLAAALELARQVEDRLLEFRVLAAEARRHAELGAVRDARAAAKSAIGLSEALRGELVDPTLLRYFAASQRDAYDVLVHSELALGNVEPAWQAADFIQARRFVELLDRPGLTDRAEMTPAAESRRALLMMRAARREELSDLLAMQDGERNAGREPQSATVRAELASVVAEIQRLQAESGDGFARGVPSVPGLADIQRELRAGEIVLEYHVGQFGAERWTIDRNQVEHSRIGDSGRVQELVASVYDALRRRSPLPEDALRELSRALLTGLDTLDASVERVIVVPDGPLHYLPFSLLPSDEGTEEPLLATRAVTYLPSLTAFAELSKRGTNGNGIAVLADPVFGFDDPRVANADTAPPGTQPMRLEPLAAIGARRAGRSGFARLPATLAESEAIVAAAGDTDVFVATGPAASRELVMSGGVRGYGILHFATHGVVDMENPTLSGLVLSAVSESGQPQSQFLRMQDIASLELQAGLVVLSGCDTGSGRLVSGEGMDGLSRAFFYAGAGAVISSRWAVPDRATAALMASFYEALLVNGRRPADALRDAQLAVRSQARWRHPYYWASFAMQGDWR